MASRRKPVNGSALVAVATIANVSIAPRAGERRLTLFRAFNAREGFTIEDDQLPPRAFMPLETGPEAGSCVDPQQLKEAVKMYYAICGWDPASGWPTEGKLLEMGLEWVNEIRSIQSK